MKNEFNNSGTRNGEYLIKASGKDIMFPALYIRGELSNYIFDEDFDQLEEIFPDSQIVTSMGAGHWVHAEAPEEFVETVLGFCLR